MSKASKINIFVYDDNWQTPAITEQHAFTKAQALLPTVENIAYFAFPWATLIDKYTQHAKDAIELQEALKTFVEPLKPYKKVVTVCQHIFMLKFQNVFHELGVTDIFWSHAVKNQTCLPDYPHIRIHPFPLYPVQAVDYQASNLEKKYLFSFVGAKPDKWYLTNSRALIFELLGEHPRGFVRSREQWHYHQKVFDEQVHGKSVEADAQTAYQQQSEEFQTVMQHSIFALCPSGTGPNSIRLWEAISMGVIPVVLADTYQPPAPDDLWQEAVVMCEESAAAIRALPQRLAQLAADDALLARKQQALQQLAARYGVDRFIDDIIALYEQFKREAATSSASSASFTSADSASIADSVNEKHSMLSLPAGKADRLLGFLSLPLTPTHCSAFVTSLSSYAFLDSAGLQQLLLEHPELNTHLERCLPQCSPQAVAHLHRLKALKGLN